MLLTVIAGPANVTMYIIPKWLFSKVEIRMTLFEEICCVWFNIYTLQDLVDIVFATKYVSTMHISVVPSTIISMAEK